ASGGRLKKDSPPVTSGDERGRIGVRVRAPMRGARWRFLLAAALSLATMSPALAQTEAEALAAFARAAPVFQHARCVNCHNRGEGAARCTSCHRGTNTAVPGAPDWRMPPPGRAGWDGLTAGEICAALKDR